MADSERKQVFLYIFINEIFYRIHGYKPCTSTEGSFEFKYRENSTKIVTPKLQINGPNNKSIVIAL